ncbi:MAG TPA: hypothetical protein ENI23_17260 [bacterium]|nr:hypothetical protein [bacterium]
MRKPSRKTLKKNADRLFSQLIRNTGFCEWCGTKDKSTLQTAHIFSRRFLVTRWVPLNANCLCSACHFKAHERPVEYTEWLKEYLGEAVYEELRRMAKTSIKKVDLEEVIEDLKAKLKDA